MRRRSLGPAGLRVRCRAVRALAAVAVCGGLAGSTTGCRHAPDTHAASRDTTPAFRVCADPNNLPFSNERLEGFENVLAERFARDLGARLEYTWWPERRGFIRHTLKARACDVMMGLPSNDDMALTTRPYYRSTYVFVERADRRPRITSFDDRRLGRLRIGVQMIGDDYANAPPAHALASRHMTRNVVGFSVYGDYSQPNPPARIVDAVAHGEIDLAVVWGPLAGYFAQKQPVPLRLTPVSPERDGPFLPFVFDISMAVRRGDTALRDRLNALIARDRSDIDALLDRYGVPRVDRKGSRPRAKG